MKGKKKIKPIWLVVAGVGSIGLIYGLYILFKKGKEAGDFSSATKQSKGSGTQSRFPLRKGSRGEEVKTLQRYLNSKTRVPLALLKVDGIFGSKTQAASQRVLGIREISESKYYEIKQKINPLG